MKLHAKTLAISLEVPDYLLDEVYEYMTEMKKYDVETINKFLKTHSKPRSRL
jgi:hypothetical protein